MDLIYDFYNKMIDFFWSLCLSAFVLLKDLFIFILDSMLSAALLLLDGFSSVFESLDLTQYITQLPASVTNVMALCGIGVCTSMIVSALLVRLMMQLIPFVRLGS